MPIAEKRWLTRMLRRRDRAIPAWSRTQGSAADLDDIFFCFRLLLGRSPHLEEWPGHAAQVGEPLPGVVAGYLNSLEFSRRDLLGQDHMDQVELADLPDFRIYAAANDAAVGRHVRGNNYELDVTQVFRRLLRPGMGVLDIGANIGYFSMLAAALVGKTGYVLAIEPNPRNTGLLEASRRVNRFAHMTVSQTAAGPRTGLLVLNRTHSNGTTSSLPEDINAMMGSEIVPCIPPDCLVLPGRDIDLIKIDVEGAEYLALQGCTAIIERNRPVIVSEFSPDLMQGISGVDGRGYLAWLIGLGYRLSVIESDGTLAETSDGEQVMQLYRRRATDHIDIVAIKDRQS